jgi:hypothetical protein
LVGVFVGVLVGVFVGVLVGVGVQAAMTTVRFAVPCTTNPGNMASIPVARTWSVKLVDVAPQAGAVSMKLPEQESPGVPAGARLLTGLPTASLQATTVVLFGGLGSGKGTVLSTTRLVTPC